MGGKAEAWRGRDEGGKRDYVLWIFETGSYEAQYMTRVRSICV